MNTYQELLAQKAALEKKTSELERQLQEAGKAERAGMIARIKQLLSANGVRADPNLSHPADPILSQGW